MSAVSLFFIGALVVALSVPANLFYAVGSPAAASASRLSSGLAPQSLSASDGTQDPGADSRDGFTVTSWAEQLHLKYASRDTSYKVGTGSIRWPFPYVVPIGDGFGPRIAPCRGCSTFHNGTDFLPGYGAPIYAIADGVVSGVVPDGGSDGFYVTIEHSIKGVDVTSLYAHMQYNSSPLAVGDTVKVGDFVGLVGQTGVATGPHLHLEIHLGGVPVDPFAWLKAHVN